MAIRIYDCVLYNGEIEGLLLRLHELEEAVDVFLIVEATKKFNGKPKKLQLRAQWASVRAFARKIRYVVIAEDIGEGNARDRETFQRNAIKRGLLDAADSDLICVSDVGEIPKAGVIRQLRGGTPGFVGFKLPTSCYFLNYRNKSGSDVNFWSFCVFPKHALQRYTPDQLRKGITYGSVAADHIDSAGGRSSEHADGAELSADIASDSHRDVKTASLPDAHDIHDTGRHGRDSLSREGYAWQVVGLDNLNVHFQKAHQHNHDFIGNEDACGGANGGIETDWSSDDEPSSAVAPQPVIICPYVFDEDREHTIQAFGLDQPRGLHLPFYFWKDEKLIGPERAFEHCWKQFPDRDVIIVHTDMRPMPDDINNAWYTTLCAQVEQLPDAGLVGCDLLYPLKSATGLWYVQCAGGFFKNGRVAHYGGGVSLAEGVATEIAYEYDERFANVRSSQWVTFGGVYIRRETIDMVGDFDERYQWAYVMDVDYCLEAHVRGQGIYQVPVNLLHEESKTSRKFLAMPEYGTKIGDNMGKFLQKWAWFLNVKA